MRSFLFSSVVWCFLFSNIRTSNGFHHPILWGTRSITTNSGGLCMKKLATSDSRGTRLKSLSRLYTPKSTNSKIIVEYGGYYEITGNSGGGGDTAHSEIRIGSTTIAKRIQKLPDVSGGGTRGSTIFPICGGISNNSLNDRTITVELVSSTDPIHFYKASFDAFMKVTEIAL